MPRRKSRLSINVRGIGRVKVSRMPRAIPKYVTDDVTGKKNPIKKQDFLEAWAISHNIEHPQTGKFAQFLKERAEFPSKKLKFKNDFHEFVQEVDSDIAGDVMPEEVESYYQQGYTPEQTVSVLKSESMEREEKRKKGLR